MAGETSITLVGNVVQTEVAEYAAGGIRLTPGKPWRPAGELESRRMPPIEAAAKTTEDAA